MAGADILQFPHPASHTPPAQPRHPRAALDLAGLQFSNRLFRHLDLQALLDAFLAEVRLTLPVEGLGYCVPDTGESFASGRTATRTFRSRMRLAGEYLGQVEVHAWCELPMPASTLLAPLAAPLANALLHHRVKQLARTDALTGLGNRSALDAALGTELARAQRFGQPLSVLILDIDHFKRINDTLGHSTGDQVIRGVAAEIRDCLRPYDQAFRYGGEEFVVILGQVGLAKSLQIAERIRRRIAQRCSTDTTTAGRITVSIGAGELRPGESLGQLFERTDGALYRAKNGGRNRCVAAD